MEALEEVRKTVYRFLKLSGDRAATWLEKLFEREPEPGERISVYL
jgi:hypothetical protein